MRLMLVVLWNISVSALSFISRSFRISFAISSYCFLSLTFCRSSSWRLISLSSMETISGVEEWSMIFWILFFNTSRQSFFAASMAFMARITISLRSFSSMDLESQSTPFLFSLLPQRHFINDWLFLYQWTRQKTSLQFPQIIILLNALLLLKLRFLPFGPMAFLVDLLTNSLCTSMKSFFGIIAGWLSFTQY